MRHRIKGRKLGRTASHRSATLRSLATALIKHKKITTTVAKAKQTRLYVEPIITKAKNDTVHARRLVAQYIYDKGVIKELFTEVIPKIGDRPGGYTRVVKLGNRVGDAAEMAILELVDYNEVAPAKKAKKKTKSDKRKTEEVVKTKSENAEEIIEDMKSEEEKKDQGIVEVIESETEKGDDLTKIEGIGPKIAEILNKSEITTFSKLAESNTEKLNEILAQAGNRYKSHDPSTWAEQAELAASGKWEDLKKRQDELKGGRE
jgi:large subunit ribosomal protein L17